jgi:ketosteroid isomerase-like protein
VGLGPRSFPAQCDRSLDFSPFFVSGVTPPELVHSYYRTIDGGDYDALADALAPGFVHRRPDRTLRGRDRFVAFVRDERPRTDTEHAIDRVYDGADGVAVQGRLLAEGDGELFAFVDAFEVDDGAITRLTTYTA